MGGLVELHRALGILAEHAVADTDVEMEVLAPGDRFNLTRREAMRPTRAFQPVGLREPGGWPQC